MKNIAEQFKYVRKNFFPGWDKDGRWKARLSTELDGAMGRCDVERKRISVTLEGGRLATVTLIHEICHAVVGEYHGKMFQGRLLKAAARAKDMGRLDLAADLRAEAAMARRSGRIYAEHVYGTIAGAARDSDVDFQQTIEYVRRQYGSQEYRFPPLMVEAKACRARS